jgi:hypothetical protein
MVAHDDDFYTRKDSKITTLPKLTGRVSKCVQANLASCPLLYWIWQYARLGFFQIAIFVDELEAKCYFLNW